MSNLYGHLTAPIAVELRRAWTRLGGSPDEVPQLDGRVPLNAAFKKQNADDELLKIIAGYRTTLPDEAVLTYLREWNAGARVSNP